LCPFTLGLPTPKIQQSRIYKDKQEKGQVKAAPMLSSEGIIQENENTLNIYEISIFHWKRDKMKLRNLAFNTPVKRDVYVSIKCTCPQLKRCV
tara:strand:+ start:201 stop:479 length:279 start_codon:yes stop_codon:yes gene_type:complete